MIDVLDDAARRVHADGYAIVEGVLSAEYVSRAKSELLEAIARESEFHGGADHADHGMVMLCSLYGGAFLELFDNEKLTGVFDRVLSDGCIVYAYTSSSMPPSGDNYSTRVHVDCPRLIPGYMTNMGATILLDDFTADNGATRFLPRSFDRAEPPSVEEFDRDAQQVIASAGSVFFFNARLWHSGGLNGTGDWRHALTLNMCRPWMKQRIDIPRAMQERGVTEMSEAAAQKLGWWSRVPASYEEYYRPLTERLFKQEAE